MEIKVFCPCGAKYKFDVEPVNERMPWPVACPVCNRDGTADANEIIQQTLATSPPSIPAAAPAPVAVPVASAPAPAPAGLRINRPAAAPAPAAPAAPAPLTAAAPTRLPAGRPKPAASGESAWKKALTILLVILAVGAFGFKWYLRIRRIARVSNAISAAADDSPASDRKWNLQADNSVVLLVQHTNHQQVVTECLALWKDKFHQTYKVIKPGSPGDEEGEFMVNAPFHGYVVLTGTRDWKEPEFEATAARLSEKFGGMVFLERDLSFSGDFIFGVYDHGANVFHARADTDFQNKEFPQVVKVEHEDWARSHGYKPGSNGSDKFNIGDADDITKACGVRIWNAPEEVRDDLILKNTKPRPAE